MYKLSKTTKVWFHGPVTKTFDGEFNSFEAASTYALDDANTSSDEWKVHEIEWQQDGGNFVSKPIKNESVTYNVDLV